MTVGVGVKVYFALGHVPEEYTFLGQNVLFLLSTFLFSLPFSEPKAAKIRLAGN